MSIHRRGGILKHFTLIEVLSPEHGGLTRAAFRRSTALAALGERVEVLCFNLVPDFSGLAEHVREHSEIGDVALSNFFHALAGSDEAITAQGARHANLSTTPQQLRPVDGMTVSDEEFDTVTQSLRLRNYVDAKGALTRVDFLDRYGKLFFVDERKTTTGQARRMTLVDRRTGNLAYQGGYGYEASAARTTFAPRGRKVGRHVRACHRRTSSICAEPHHDDRPPPPRRWGSVRFWLKLYRGIYRVRNPART
ncbi:hypothetical protein AGM16_0028 [Brevibacterium phage AGM16]|uniref:Uncharacterized protein n=1 Tax=Brevibacterium phage AGM16 TaxID=2591418 RepID=A0A7D0KJ23_9CAUD|nr:hypothetical protein AGM16_0028 [Brevibacterium phage AGM16]